MKFLHTRYPELHKPLDGVGGQSQQAGPDFSLSVPTSHRARLLLTAERQKSLTVTRSTSS